MAKKITSNRSFQTIISGEKISILKGQIVSFTKKTIEISGKVFTSNLEEIEDVKMLIS